MEAQKIVEYLQGTCNTLFEATRELYDKEIEELTPKQLSHIDDNIFNCQDCNWWFDVSEEADSDEVDGICEDCHSSQKCD